MPLLLAVWLAVQGPSASVADGRATLAAGLDTLYAGDFAGAAAYFTRLAAQDTADAAPLIFEAGAYIWWAEALEDEEFARARIDSLLALAIERTRATVPTPEFWLATALGYRARERELHGSALGAAKDAKAMRDAYRRVLAADTSCGDCYLGLGLYDYGLARAGFFARLFAKLIGLGSGNAERGLAHVRRAAERGDLARVEATWVLASALMREAERDRHRRTALRDEARALVRGLGERYPRNPVFRRFLQDAVQVSAP